MLYFEDFQKNNLYLNYIVNLKKRILPYDINIVDLYFISEAWKKFSLKYDELKVVGIYEDTKILKIKNIYEIYNIINIGQGFEYFICDWHQKSLIYFDSNENFCALAGEFELLKYAMPYPYEVEKDRFIQNFPFDKNENSPELASHIFDILRPSDGVNDIEF